MVNIYDVAREAGVSRSTVSRVLNNHSGVNEETRQKVLDVMERLSYQPNTNARSLASRETKMIGVITKHIGNTFYADFMKNIHISAEGLGYGTLFCFSNPNNPDSTDYSRALIGKVDGILFVGEKTVSREQLKRLEKSHIPMAIIENEETKHAIISVNIDNFEAAYNATEYLLLLGHRKIAHISGNDSFFELRERARGYKAAFKKNSIPIDESLIQFGRWSAAETMKKTHLLFEQHPDLTAAFCANDIIAAGAVQAAVARGLKVPEDFSVVGFDDMIIPELIPYQLPSITTVRQPKKQMAEYAVKALVDWIETGIISEDKVFQTEFVIRNSTALKKTSLNS